MKTLARAEALAMLVLLACATALTLAGLLVGYVWLGWRPYAISDVDLSALASAWLTLVVYAVPFAAFIGAPAYIAVSRVGHRTKLALLVGIVATVAARCTAEPVIEQCEASYYGRQRIEQQLAPAAAATLEPVETLSGGGGMCSLYFRYSDAGEWKGVSILPDVIHGPKIYWDTQ